MTEDMLRYTLLASARAMNAQGLNQGAAGNLSLRMEHGMLITPSALVYEDCLPEDMVLVDWNGQSQGARKPSSEWRMHRDIYQAHAKAQCILHAHAAWCATLACLNLSIPALHYMVAIAGGDSIRCAAYAPFGSEALSQNALAALHDRSAALLAHHGMICYAASAAEALALAVEVEFLARIYAQALHLNPHPSLLSQAQMDEVLTRFRDYRKQQ